MSGSRDRFRQFSVAKPRAAVQHQHQTIPRPITTTSPLPRKACFSEKGRERKKKSNSQTPWTTVSLKTGRPMDLPPRRQQHGSHSTASRTRCRLGCLPYRTGYLPCKVRCKVKSRLYLISSLRLPISSNRFRRCPTGSRNAHKNDP